MMEGTQSEIRASRLRLVPTALADSEDDPDQDATGAHMIADLLMGHGLSGRC